VSRELLVAHTADVAPATLTDAYALLVDAFEGDFSDDDWDHTLGGIHALAYEGSELVGHASVVQRRLLHGGRALRCGYVEGVGVRADARRRGHGDAVLEAVERVIRGAYELGALGATDIAIPFYAARGWQPWRGRTSVLSPSGVFPTPEADGAVYVLPGDAPLDLDGELTCDWRDGDVW
jgi:aminoglycoside 2'-N-acetyltransferase I